MYKGHHKCKVYYILLDDFLPAMHDIFSANWHIFRKTDRQVDRLSDTDRMVNNKTIHNIVLPKTYRRLITNGQDYCIFSYLAALMKSVCEGGVPSVKEIEGATGPVIAKHVIDSLLEQAVQHNNAAAVDELAHIAGRTTGTTQESIVDILQARNIQVSLKLLPNAYIAGREKLVRSLVNRGFILHPTVVSYTVLLTTVCQKKDYPHSLLRYLLNIEKTIKRPFQDCSKEDVYERCLKYCCMNDRDDLVELFLKRGAGMSADTLQRYSSCIGHAMSHIGCHFRAVRTPRGLVRCVDICWQDRGLTQIDGAWVSKQNLHAFLTRLDVSNNQLSYIPYCLLDGTLRCLEDLDCSGNKLKSLWADDADRLPRDKYK